MSNQTKLLAICIQAGFPNSGVPKPEAVPALIVGAPGTSKTAIMQGLADQIAKHLGRPFPLETMACPQMAPENIAGVPVPDREKKVTDLFVLSIGKKLIDAEYGIMFLDEFSSAADTVAAASLTLTQSGMLGDHKLPSSVARVLAMNDPERATAGRPLMAPESNRVCWINWELELAPWVDYMKGGQGALEDIVMLPNNWEVENFPIAASLVTAYLGTTPGDFLVEPPPAEAGKAWPSPRSWRNATRLLAACFSLGQKVNSDLAASAVCGCVGEAAGRKFIEYAIAMDLPDAEVVLATGPSFAWPKRDDKVLCILESVAAVACLDRPDSVKRWQTACEIVASLARPDIIINVITYLMGKKPKDATVPKAAGVFFKVRKEMNMEEGI